MRSAWILSSLALALAGGAQEKATVTYFLKHQESNQQELERRFWQVSDPESDLWGEHLSLEEVAQLQAPHPEHAAALEAHLDSLGVAWTSTVAGDKVQAEFSLELLDTELYGLKSAAESTVLPAHLRPMVDMMGGLLKKEKKQEEKKKPVRSPARPSTPTKRDTADPQSCLADRAVPPCLRSAYGLGDTAGGNAKNAQAVIVNQNFKDSDLVTFQKEYKLPNQPIVKKIGTQPEGAGDEASLDVQYITAMGQLVPTWWVSIDGHSSQPFTNWLVWAANATDLPFVHSLSVGESEADFASDNGIPAIQRMNEEMMALGARGVSIVFASGDSGYQPAQKYGAASPYVTAVGGVFNGELGNDILQVDDISTGGFSSLDVNPAQKYQEAAIAHYLTTSGERPGKFNSSHRCVPDVAAYDAGFYIVQDGSDSPIGGTSAACPVVAGMLSLLNEKLLNAGHSTLGFANPFLYANADAFLDIIHGGNNGFDAVKGYDPASGLGTFSPTTFQTLLGSALKRKEELRAKRARSAVHESSKQQTQQQHEEEKQEIETAIY